MLLDFTFEHPQKKSLEYKRIGRAGVEVGKSAADTNNNPVVPKRVRSSRKHWWLSLV